MGLDSGTRYFAYKDVDNNVFVLNSSSGWSKLETFLTAIAKQFINACCCDECKNKIEDTQFFAFLPMPIITEDEQE